MDEEKNRLTWVTKDGRRSTWCRPPRRGSYSWERWFFFGEVEKAVLGGGFCDVLGGFGGFWRWFEGAKMHFLCILGDVLMVFRGFGLRLFFG